MIRVTLSITMRLPITPRNTAKERKITRSTWPISRSALNMKAPTVEPARPPMTRMPPILKSTLLRRQWAMTPDTDAATT